MTFSYSDLIKHLLDIGHDGYGIFTKPQQNSDELTCQIWTRYKIFIQRFTLTFRSTVEHNAHFLFRLVEHAMVWKVPCFSFRSCSFSCPSIAFIDEFVHELLVIIEECLVLQKTSSERIESLVCLASVVW